MWHQPASAPQFLLFRNGVLTAFFIGKAMSSPGDTVASPRDKKPIRSPVSCLMSTLKRVHRTPESIVGLLVWARWTVCASLSMQGPLIYPMGCSLMILTPATRDFRPTSWLLLLLLRLFYSTLLRSLAGSFSPLQKFLHGKENVCSQQQSRNQLSALRTIHIPILTEFTLAYGRGDDPASQHYHPYWNFANGSIIRRKPCRFFAVGRCLRGDSCTFRHDAGRVDTSNGELSCTDMPWMETHGIMS